MTVGLAPRLECVACLLRQANEAVLSATADGAMRETALRQSLGLMAQMDWRQSPPAMAQKLHRLIREATQNPDPYARVKERLNRRAAEIEPEWRRRFGEAFLPFEAAVRTAIVGNLLDVGAKTRLGDADVMAAFEKALTAPLVGSVGELESAVAGARDILYLADNAGEIVFDRWLLSLLPLGRVTVAVRGGPVLNDATLEDARWIGLPDFCDVIANGSDAPGTILGDCSPEFRERFREADLVIAKGQGNFESLAGCGRDVFFLFKVKCDVVGESLGCPRGSLVVHREMK